MELHVEAGRNPVVTDRVEQLLADLTLEEKVSLTAGTDWWHTPPIERAGIPQFKFTDGPVGARGAMNASGPPSACFPCGTALAATWDTDLVNRVGAELGEEVKAKGAHMLLAPTVNLHRSPLAGRNFECYSEDPFLTARMAVAYVSGVQSRGVGCCIKHFVANDSEYERYTIDSDVSERALRELYLRPFEVAVAEAKPLAVMPAYNKLNGTYCSENELLLTSILRDEWHFEGMVVSDWGGTHSTVKAANAGLDLEMPGPPQHRGEMLVDAVKNGEVEEALIDVSVRRILRAMDATGALAHGPGEETSQDTPERREVARAAARSAIVLLKNDVVVSAPVLPLPVASLRSVAVIGANADAMNIFGGGSAAVTPYHAVTPLDGLRSRLADEGIEVVHEPGGSITRFPPPADVRWVRTPDGQPGIEIEIVRGADPDGTDVIERQVTGRAALMRGRFGTEPWSARFRATFTAPATGRHVFQGASGGRFRISLDNEVVVDGWNDDMNGRGRRVEGGIHLVEAQEYDLRADLVPATDPSGLFMGMGGLEIRCQAPIAEDAFERAVAAAAAADAAIVIVGTNADWETEGRDRKTMDLPGNQVELIRAVVAANAHTAVVVNAGAPVTMDWADEVPAVLQSWFLGQETGNALADVLVGDHDASGRLPTTIPRRIEDTPAFTNYPGEFGRVEYGEGIFIGYRWYDAREIAPRFAFGHGLSYTSFGYDAVSASPTEARVRVSNTGTRAGTEVVQLYVRDVESTVARPPKELKGFAKVTLSPGESTEVTFALDDSTFAFWDTTAAAWRVEPGEFELLVGSSSADIRQRAAVTVPAP
jgi:beta-glucosidase